MSTLRKRRFWRWIAELLLAAAAGPPVGLLIEFLFPRVGRYLLIPGMVAGASLVVCVVRWINHLHDPRRQPSRREPRPAG
jgi:hypothetical protein